MISDVWIWWEDACWADCWGLLGPVPPAPLGFGFAMVGDRHSATLSAGDAYTAKTAVSA